MRHIIGRALDPRELRQVVGAVGYAVELLPFSAIAEGLGVTEARVRDLVREFFRSDVRRYRLLGAIRRALRARVVTRPEDN